MPLSPQQAEILQRDTPVIVEELFALFPERPSPKIWQDAIRERSLYHEKRLRRPLIKLGWCAAVDGTWTDSLKADQTRKKPRGALAILMVGDSSGFRPDARLALLARRALGLYGKELSFSEWNSERGEILETIRVVEQIRDAGLPLQPPPIKCSPDEFFQMSDEERAAALKISGKNPALSALAGLLVDTCDAILEDLRSDPSPFELQGLLRQMLELGRLDSRFKHAMNIQNTAMLERANKLNTGPRQAESTRIVEKLKDWHSRHGEPPKFTDILRQYESDKRGVLMPDELQDIAGATAYGKGVKEKWISKTAFRKRFVRAYQAVFHCKPRES